MQLLRYSVIAFSLIFAAAPLRSQDREIIDEFVEPDGDPPSNWTIFQGDWKVESEELSGEDRNGQEAWIWYNEQFGGDITIEFDLRWESPQADAVGRHGGLSFLSSFPGAPQGRYNAMQGYTLDWIDRTTDHGIRCHKWSNGAETVILPDLLFQGPDPPEHWKIEVTGDKFAITFDDVPFAEVFDTSFRQGYIGFWTWSNNNHIHVDNFKVTFPDLLVVRDLPTSIVAGSEFEVALEVTAFVPFTNATIRERVPRFWTAANPSAPGTIETDATGGQTIVWAFTGGLADQRLTYNLTSPNPYANVGFAGSSVVADGRPFNISGDSRFTGGTDGFANEALTVTLRQAAGSAGCNPGENLMRLDYLTDGDAISELTVVPALGQSLSPDYNGTSPSQGQAATGSAVWTRNASPAGWFQLDVCDQCMAYVAFYADNTTGQTLTVRVATASDDSEQILIDGKEVWIHNICRGAGSAIVQDRSPYFELTPGKHLVLQKVFEGGGGFNAAIRFEDQDGNPLVGPGIGGPIELSIDPADYSVGGAFVLREIPDSLDVGESGKVTLKLRVQAPTDGAAIEENVPAGFAISEVSPGGTVAGQKITWNLAGALSQQDFSYRVAVPEGSLDAAFQGTATLGGNVTPIIGDSGFNRGGFDANGFIKHWLVLGPLDTFGLWFGDPANPNTNAEGPSSSPENGDLRADYLQGGGLTEQTIRPFDGMRIAPQYGGDGLANGAKSLGLEAVTRACAPEVATWEAFITSGGSFNHNDYFGQEVDSHATYAATYVTNTTGAPISTNIAIDSDDSFIAYLNGVEAIAFEHPPCSATLCGRGMTAEPGVPNVAPITLPPGESFLLTRTHDGYGGSGHRLRFQDNAGNPLPAGQLTVSLKSTKSPPAVYVKRLLSSDSYQVGGAPITVTLRVESNGSHAVKVRETLPAGFSADLISDGGALTGDAIEWNLVGVTGTKLLTYTLLPGACASGGSFCGNGAAASEYTVDGGQTHAIRGDSSFRRQSTGGDSLGPWDVRNIGTTGGSTQRVGDRGVDLSALGGGVAGSRDEFRFVSLRVSGDFELSSRIDCLSDVGGSGRGGLMVRDTFDTFSAHAYFALTSVQPAAGGVGTLKGNSRKATKAGQSSANIAIGDDEVNGLPFWMQIKRVGARISFLRSPDGINYTEVATRDIGTASNQVALGTDTYIGLAVTGGGSGQTRFDFRDVRGKSGGADLPPFTPVPIDPPTLTQATPGANQVALAWTAPAGGTPPTAYVILRSNAAGGPYVPVAEVPAPATAHTDTALAANTNYCYVVRSKRGSDESANSNELCARTPGGGAPTFKRGDVDGNQLIDISDPVSLLGSLFLGTGDPACLEAGDFDDNGAVDITDAVNNLGYQFLGTGPPAAPGPLNCGVDPAGGTFLGCASGCP